MRTVCSLLFILITTMTSCIDEKQIQEQTERSQPKIIKEPYSNSLEGTWELISATTVQGDSTHHKDLTDKKMIKIINNSHFAFLNHDINKEKDSLSYYVSRGGIYTLTDHTYVEFLEYCSSREWEGNTFQFNIEIKGDTLIQKGLEEIEKLGVQREITEVYLKSKK